MAKYIIDIDNENAIVDGHLSIPLDLSIRGSEGETVELNLICGNNLTPYEEPDIDAIKKEAYEDGYKSAILSASKTENTCQFCVYKNCGHEDEPCKNCKHNFLDMFKRKKNVKIYL